MWILWVCNSPRGILLQHVWCKIIMLLLCHPKNSQIWWFQPSRIPMYGKNVHIIPPTYCISQNFWQFAFTTPPFWGSQGCVTWLCYHLLIFDPMYMYIFTHVNMYVCIKNNTMYICKYTYIYNIPKLYQTMFDPKNPHSHMSTRLKPPPGFPIGIRRIDLACFPPSKSPWGLQVWEKKKHWLVVW